MYTVYVCVYMYMRVGGIKRFSVYIYTTRHSESLLLLLLLLLSPEFVAAELESKTERETKRLNSIHPILRTKIVSFEKFFKFFNRVLIGNYVV